MKNEQKKTTVLNTSVGADAEQSLNKNTTSSITETEGKNNEPLLPKLPKIRLISAGYMPTISQAELLDNIYKSNPVLIQNLLSAGLYLLVGAPKVGKSFMALQIARHVSTGLPLWGCEVQQGTVLYLALEDDYARLQRRSFRMFGTESNEELYFSTYAKQLDDGLNEQMEEFLKMHTNTRLIIIDTLQKIRENQTGKASYSSDYEIMGKLKKFADSHGVCVLPIHHTRKQQADDKFERVSGTNGIFGAADGALILEKEHRTSREATLNVSGRDLQDQCFYLEKDEATLAWNLLRIENEPYKEPPDPVILKIEKFLTKEHPLWEGTATELVADLDVEISPIILTKRLNVKAGSLLNDYQIRYEYSRTHEGRKIKLEREKDKA